MESERRILLTAAGVFVAAYVLISVGAFLLFGFWALVPIFIPVIGFLLFLVSNWAQRQKI